MAAPMLPPAPARFSIRTGWPSVSLSFCWATRATISVGPPGAKGTITRIGLAGQVWARAGSVHKISSIANAVLEKFLISVPLLHAARDRSAPFLDRLEAGQFSRLRFDLRPHCRIREAHVQWNAQRLVDVPGRVDEQLDAVAFRVHEIDRQRVAVRHRREVRHFLGHESGVHLPRPGRSSMRKEIWVNGFNGSRPGPPPARTIWGGSRESPARNNSFPGPRGGGGSPRSAPGKP